MARTVATVLGCLVVASMLAWAIAGYAQEPTSVSSPDSRRGNGSEPQRIADAQPLPACVDLEECPIPSEVAALPQATGEYGEGDYPPCREVRAGGQVCVMLPMP